MLILTRRIGETVVIGDEEINFTVLGVKGNQVRLGFIGSKDISIHRQEIYNRIQLEKYHAHSKDAVYIDKAIIEPIRCQI